MSTDPVVLRWHRSIVSDAEAKLKRPLRDYERRFVLSRQGLIALEMIHDTVTVSAAAELERYLSSER